MSKIKIGGALIIVAVLLVAFTAIIMAGHTRSNEERLGDEELVVGTKQQIRVDNTKDYERDIKVLINGEEVIFDVPPQVVDGRVMVPACAIAVKLRAVVQWNEEASAIIITSKENAATTTNEYERIVIAEPPTVVDISPDDRFYRHIMSAIRLGLIDVPRDGRIEPERYVTVAEFITMLGRLHETWSEQIGIPGIDSCYNRYLEWAVDVGIIRGNEIGKLMPNALITYEQKAVFVYRYINVFRDSWVWPARPPQPSIEPPRVIIPLELLKSIGVSKNAFDAVKFLTRMDILTVCTHTILDFTPQYYVSREAALAVLIRMNARYYLAIQRQNVE